MNDYNDNMSKVRTVSVTIITTFLLCRKWLDRDFPLNGYQFTSLHVYTRIKIIIMKDALLMINIGDPGQKV